MKNDNSASRMFNAQFLLTFILRILSLVVQAVLPLYLSAVLHLPSYIIGIMISSLWIGNGLGAITGAAFLRDWREGGIAGLIVLALSFSGYFFFSSYYLLTVFILVGGFGSGLLQPLLAPSMHAGSNEGRPFRGVSLYSTALSLALIIGPLLSSLVIGISSFKTLFIALSILCLLALSLPLGQSSRNSISQPKKTFFISIIRETILQRGFRREFFMNMVYSLTLPIVLSFTGLVAQRVYNLDSNEILFSLTTLFALSSIIRYSMRNMKTRRFDRVMLLPSLFLLLSSLLLAWSNSWALFLAGLLLFSVPHALIYPWTLYNVFQSSEKERLVQSSYIFSLSSGISEFISPPLTSLAIYSFGIVNGMVVMVPFSLFAFAIAVLLYR